MHKAKAPDTPIILSMA